MKRILFVLLSFVALASAFADINTDKAMSKIARDRKTYISADARAATEQEAYDMAMSKLTVFVADYLKDVNGKELPEAVYLPKLSGIYDRLTNHIADNRYRVMLYVRKSDIKPLSDTSGAIVLSKNEENNYEALPVKPTPEPADTVVVTDTIRVVQVIEKPLDPTLSMIASKRSGKEITSTIQSLGKSGALGGAAKFPIDRANDFYVVVIRKDDAVIAILHYENGQWSHVSSGAPADLSDYSDCKAYWFTLSSKN